MTQNATSDKAVPATCADFLGALYSSVDPKLWLELRCIHPVSKQVKTLWMPVHKREAILKQADALNGEGYSLYFAPCPRTKQKGNAESAAMLPALWVDLDCDNDPVRREAALAKLHEFNPLPSIIVDSGGGWHAYWLFSEPFSLTEQNDREYAAQLLRGLFCALGADPEYVKSVASIMRLPDSINTKPERGGAIVTIVEFAPDRRYPISDFEWLDAKPDHPTKLLNEPDHPPLPRITLDYLTHGATNGTRNNALFDAACQFRDAGYSQSEAEAQLVPRYVADGSSENPSAREREARTTVASVYKQTARDPLPQQPGHEQVKALVSRFSKAESTRDLPTPEQVAEAVKACASLDALQWAVERKHLKNICGGEFTMADLDRLYRQFRREAARSHTTMSSGEGYLELDGCMVFEKQTERGTVRSVIATWAARVVEWITQIDTDEQIDHVMRLGLCCGERRLTLDVPSELFGDSNALQRFIAARAGGIYTVRAGMSKHLVPAILALSDGYPCRSTYRFMGWTKINGKLTYLSPGLCVDAQGALREPPVIELEARLHAYGLSWSEGDTWSQTLKAFGTAIKVFPKHLAPTCIAFTLLPIVQRFFPNAAPKPALHLVGTYQSGKSEVAALMTSFYGQFTRDEPPAQWGDTVNAVETLGYTLSNALYWVDDYKTMYADERTFTRFLQSYSRGMGRGRLTREAKLRQERPCRGLLLSTGETTLEGEASVLSRMLVLDVPPWEQRDPGGKALSQADTLRHLLPGFTAKFAAWVAHQVEEGGFEKRLEQEFATSVSGYQEKIRAMPGQKANTGRVVQNWAVLVTTYRLIREFLETEDADDLLPGWKDIISHTLQTVRQERASDVFLNILGQLLSGGQVLIDDDMRTPREPIPGIATIGYRDQDYVYLLPDIALQAANRVHTLHFTSAAIGAQLREDGWLIPGSAEDRLVVQMRIRGSRVWLWRLKTAALGGEETVSEAD